MCGASGHGGAHSLDFNIECSTTIGGTHVHIEISLSSKKLILGFIV